MGLSAQVGSFPLSYGGLLGHISSCVQSQDELFFILIYNFSYSNKDSVGYVGVSLK